MSLAAFSEKLIPAIEVEMQAVVEEARRPETNPLIEMLAYHLGWEGEGAGLEARGKRLRPLIVLLSTGACGESWERALPAAASVELLHNFSLIHDDIQDHSAIRRGRLTVWKKWGVPQAINTGDTMFTLAQIAILRLAQRSSPEVALKAAHVMQIASLELTQGQFLDLSYENQRDLPLEAYWPMVSGKTAALLGACTELGAIIACSPDSVQAEYKNFGRLLGLAFQVQDDLLGIWGDAARMGKSNKSDLLAGKKSLPVLYALDLNQEFARRWKAGPITPEEVPELAELLDIEGARAFTTRKAQELTEQALQSLKNTPSQGEAADALWELANWLLGRQS